MVVRRSIAHKRRRNCSKSVCDSKLLLSDISHVFKKNYTSSCAGITHILYIFIKANTSTRLARLTSAGSRKLCLRLLGCQPGCTIVYGRLKICAHYQGTGSRNIFGRKTTKIAFNSFYITKPAFLMSRTINI